MRIGKLMLFVIASLVLIVACGFTQERAMGIDADDIRGISERAVSLTKASGDDLQLYDFVEKYFMDNDYESLIIDDETEVWAIAKLSSPSVAQYINDFTSYGINSFLDTQEGALYVNSLIQEQNDFLSSVDLQKINYEVKYTFSTILNAIGFKVKYGDLDRINSISGISALSISQEYSAPDAIKGEATNLSIDLRGQTGYTGAGQVVAVIDTGLDYNHEAFSVMPEDGKIDLDYIESVLEKTSAQNGYSMEYYGNVSTRLYANGALTADMVYHSQKIPFMYDYADNDYDVMDTEASVALTGGHGTHVSGVACGNNGVDFFGAAPDAQLAFLKTFSDESSTTSTINILAAISDAITLNVDVVNMSLGSAAGFSEDEFSTYYDILSEAGIIVCNAAGNAYYAGVFGPNGNYPSYENIDFGVVSSASSYSNNFSVASMQTTPRTAHYLLNGENKIIYTDIRERSFVDELLTNTGLGELYFVEVGLGMADDFSGKNLEGKIALILRGENSFDEKIANAANAGAVGAIIYNNVEGDKIYMTVTENRIPACFIDKADGLSIIANGGTVSFSNDFIHEYPLEMSDFSSWGPVGDLSIKPEITAYGGNILSSVPFGNQYNYMSGTSMSSPYVAGACAVLRQYVEETFPELNEKEVRQLVYRIIMSTADIQTDTKNTVYSPRRQGAGLIDINGALNTSAYLFVEGQEKTKIELGDDKEKTGIYEMAFSVVNYGNSDLQYNIGAIVMTEALKDDIYFATSNYTLSPNVKFFVDGVEVGDSVIVRANEIVDIRVIVELSSQDRSYLDVFPYGNFVEGYIRLTSQNVESLAVPFLAFYGDWNIAPIFDANLYQEENYDVWPTAWIGATANGAMSQMGAYAFTLPEGYEAPTPSPDKVALATGTIYGGYHMIYAGYFGLLRNAYQMNFEMIDDDTGEIYLEAYANYVRQASYQDSYGQMVPSMIPMEWTAFDTVDRRPSTYVMGLPGNTPAHIKVTALLNEDIEEGVNANDTFETAMNIDRLPTEVLLDNTKYRYEDGRLFIDIEVKDTFYAMAVYPALFSNGTIHDVFSPVPVYQDERNQSSIVTFDITEHAHLINSDSYWGIITYDYALNNTMYTLYLKYNDFLTEARKTKGEYAEYSEQTYSMGINEQFTVEPIVYPLVVNTVNSITCYYESDNTDVLREINGVLTAVNIGKANVSTTILYSHNGRIERLFATTEVNVLPLPTEVKFEKSIYTLAIGESSYLNYVWVGGNAKLDYSVISSADPEIVEAHDGGMRGRKEGMTTVRGEFFFSDFEGNQYSLKTSSRVVVKNGVSLNKIAPESISATVTLNGVSIEASTKQPGTVIQNPECKVGDIITVNAILKPWFASQEIIVEQLSGYAGDYKVNGNEITINYVYSASFVIYSPHDHNQAVFFAINITNPDSYLSISNPTFVSKEIISLSEYNSLGIDTRRFSDSQKVFEEISFETAMTEGLKIERPIVTNPHNSQVYGQQETGTFVLDKEGTVLTSWIAPEGQIEDLYIPEGVEIIGARAFQGIRNVTNIHMPSTLRRIEERAFASANINHVYSVPSSLEYIGVQAFYACFLFYIDLPEKTDNPCIIDDYAFWNTRLHEFYVPEGVTYLGDYCFFLNVEITDFYLADTIQYVGEMCFTHCKFKVNKLPADLEHVGRGGFALMYENFSMNTLYLGGKVQYVGAAAFLRADIGEIIIGKDLKLVPFGSELINEFAHYTIEEGSVYFKEEGSMILSKNGVTLYYVQDSGEDLVIPYGVVRIDGGFLSWNYRYTNVHIPETVKRIGEVAFVRASNVYFYGQKAPVLEIGFSMFYDSFYHKTSIYYFEGEGYLDSSYLCRDVQFGLQCQPAVKLSEEELYGVNGITAEGDIDGSVKVEIDKKLLAWSFDVLRQTNNEGPYEVIMSGLNELVYFDYVEYNIDYSYLVISYSGTPWDSQMQAIRFVDFVTTSCSPQNAYSLMDEIENVYPVNLDSLGQINNLWIKYNALTDKEQQFVANKERLQYAEEIFNVLQFNISIKEIRDDVHALRSRIRYDALNDELKTYVTNYHILVTYELQKVAEEAIINKQIEHEKEIQDINISAQERYDELNNEIEKLKSEIDELEQKRTINCASHSMGNTDNPSGPYASIIILISVVAVALILRKKQKV